MSEQNKSVDKRVKRELRCVAQVFILNQVLDLTWSRIWKQIAEQVETQPRVLDQVSSCVLWRVLTQPKDLLNV